LDINKIDLKDLLDQLNEEFLEYENYRKSLLLNSSIEDQVELEDLVEAELENEDKDIKIRFLKLLDLIGRQEERLAFSIVMLLYSPTYCQYLKYHIDRAQSGRMGFKKIINIFEGFKLSGKYPEQLAFHTIDEILIHWRTGSPHLFQIYLLKWTKEFPEIRRKLHQIQYAGYYILRQSGSKKELKKSDNYFISIPELFEIDYFKAYEKLEEFEEVFDEIFFGFEQ